MNRQISNSLKMSLGALAMSCAFSLAMASGYEWTDKDTEDYWWETIEKSSLISTKPRSAHADETRGEGILETFGTQYMPNAYAHYQEVRAKAKENEQLLAENFPNGVASDSTGGSLYGKVSNACSRAVGVMFRRRDELCYFYIAHKFGVFTDQDLASLDERRICIMLPEPPPFQKIIEASQKEMSDSERDFAGKYLPECLAAHQRLSDTYKTLNEAISELFHEERILDIPYPVVSSFARLIRRLRAEARDSINGIVDAVKKAKLLHAVGEITASQLANDDVVLCAAYAPQDKDWTLANCLKQCRHDNFDAKLLVKRAKKDTPKLYAQIDFRLAEIARTDATMSILSNMVAIPGQNFMIGKYEVTRREWIPLKEGKSLEDKKDLDFPIDGISWYDCDYFIKKLNSRKEVIEKGLVFRLPTFDEWRTAFFAGGPTNQFSREIEAYERVRRIKACGWVDEDDGKESTRPVGKKTPNEFGIYDMIGNVSEWTSTKVIKKEYFGSYQQHLREVEYFRAMGGNIVNGWYIIDEFINEGSLSKPNEYPKYTGLRLLAEKSKQSVARAKPKSEAEKTRSEAEKTRSKAEETRSKAEEKTRQAAFAWKGESKNIPISDSVSIELRSVPGNLWFGKYEVTQAQWETLMGENPSKFKGADNPVENVSWDECQVFLMKLNALPAVKKSGMTFRLPTEEEWKVSCHAGATGDFCRLDDGTEISADTLVRVAWVYDNSDKKTHPVGQKEPNAFGLYDMYGNVFEWCQDEIGALYSFAKGKEYEHHRIIRGHSIYSSHKAYSMTSVPLCRAPSDRNRGTGFRLCASGEAVNP